MKKIFFFLLFAITSVAFSQTMTIPSYSTIKLTKLDAGSGMDSFLTIGADSRVKKVTKSVITDGLATTTQLATKEPSITAGTTSQYYRGDKTWQSLNKAAVGLSNVDNTADANKPISTATQNALNLKQATLTNPITGNGPGTINTIPVFTNSGTIGNSSIIQLGNGDVIFNGLPIGLGGGSNTTNLAIGSQSLISNTTGIYNIAIGASALRYGTAISENTAIGTGALQNSTSSRNTGIGISSLGNNTTGFNNIAIGGLSGTDAVANITTQSNQIVIGNNNSTNAYIKIGWTVTSDARDKTNFAPVPYGLSFVNSLQPIKYQFRESRTTNVPVGDVKYGFKAQDILALEGANSVIIDAKDPNNLKYTEGNMIPVLVNAIKELSQKVSALEAEVQILKNN